MDSKPWYASKTIWSSIVAIAATGVSLFAHKSLSADTQQSVVDFITSAIPEAIAIVSSAVAIWGRIKAETKIGTN